VLRRILPRRFRFLSKPKVVVNSESNASTPNMARNGVHFVAECTAELNRKQAKATWSSQNSDRNANERMSLHSVLLNLSTAPLVCGKRLVRILRSSDSFCFRSTKRFSERPRNEFFVERPAFHPQTNGAGQDPSYPHLSANALQHVRQKTSSSVAQETFWWTEK